MDNFEENDYGFNDFEDDYSNELNAEELVDVRIILTNLDYLEFLSKAVSNFDLSNFNTPLLNQLKYESFYANSKQIPLCLPTL